LIDVPKVGRIGQKWAKKDGNCYKFCVISQKLFDEFFFKSYQMNAHLTTISSAYTILIEMPEVGQIGQKRVKSMQVVFGSGDTPKRS